MTISEYDPQVEFLEIGTTVNNVRAWKVYGPDMNGVYGGMQGTGSIPSARTNSDGGNRWLPAADVRFAG